MPILPTEALKLPWAKRGRARGAPGTVGALLVAWLAVSMCAAQEPAADAPAAEGPAASEKTPPVRGAAGAVEYVGPDTYILLDAEGRPQAMPGMTYEDFMAAWKKSQQGVPHDSKPRFAIDKLDITGKAVGDHAELQCQATVRLLSDEPVDVPLGLVGAILRGQPRFDPDARTGDVKKTSDGGSSGSDRAREEYLDFAPGRGGLVAHLSGPVGARRTISLDLLTPLARDGAETTLALNCPRALASTLAIDIAGPVSEANVNRGALLPRESIAEGGTRLSAAGVAGQFRLTWSTAKVAAAELSTVLIATGAIQVSIDGRTVRTDARLTVRSYGGSFDRFRVRLPHGATLLERRAKAGEKEPAYRITLEDGAGRGDAKDSTATGGQVALVQLPAKQQGPVVVELATEQPLELSKADVAVKLEGFEVLGAVRQYGDVALRVADDWQARWDVGQYVRQVDTGELEASLQQSGLKGSFQYDRQPWSLGVRVSPREIRVQVTPEYELECLPDEARLRVHLTYQILGGRGYEFRVDLRGWERTADPLESGGLVDRDRVMLTENGVLVLPLSQPSLRRAEISFVVRRPILRDARALDLPLPMPLAESAATGDLVVWAAPGIELLPATARLKGLIATPITTDAVATDQDREEFHFRSFQPDIVFAADRVSRPRDVSVNVATQIGIIREQAQVRERVEYEVRFEPIAELVFDLPGELRPEEGAVEVTLLDIAGDGETNGGDKLPETLLRFAPNAEESDPSRTVQVRRARVVLPQPRLGRFAVELRYMVSHVQSPSSLANWSIPLARPIDGRLGEWRATVGTPRDLAVALDPNVESMAWKEVESAQIAAGQKEGNEFVATRPEPTLPLVVRRVDVNLPSATLVERVWLQTWLTGSTRQDRAAFRFRTVGRLVAVELPPETAAEDVEVRLDGQSAERVSREAGRISVPLAAADDRGAAVDQLHAARPHTLELRYRRASGERVLTRRRLTPPQLVGTNTLADVYWQIVLPADRHVVQSPSQLAAASHWQWLGSFWGRRPTRSQAELEQWVGASTQQAPTSAQNEYLYSGLSPVSSIEVVTAPRWLIVLVSSGLVLAVVLAWIYVPVVRRRWIAVALACVLAFLAVTYPTPAMLIGQASILGAVLAAIAAFISRLTARPAQWYLPSPGGSTRRHITSRAESVVIGPVTSAAASTAPTAPLGVSESEP